jgi:hypothetical protein
LRHYYIDAVVIGLLISAACHLAAGGWTDRVLSRTGVVRGVGLCLLLLAVPCFLWRGWYFLMLGSLLAISGAWRLLTPENSIKLQKITYPRWVHGLLLLGGAGLVFALQP